MSSRNNSQGLRLAVAACVAMFGLLAPFWLAMRAETSLPSNHRGVLREALLPHLPDSASDLQSLSVPNDFKLLYPPVVNRRGSRALLVGKPSNTEESQLLLWEEGVGSAKISPETVEVRGRPSIDGLGRTAVFFTGKQGGEKSSLASWQEGLGYKKIKGIECVGSWGLVLSDDAKRVVLHAQEKKAECYLPDKRSVGALFTFSLPRTVEKTIRLSEVRTLADDGSFSQVQLRGQKVVAWAGQGSHADSGSRARLSFGLRTATVAGDVDGNGRSDLLSFGGEGSEGLWEALILSDAKETLPRRVASYRLGAAQGVPVEGDYNGDGIIDFATYEPHLQITKGVRTDNWQIYFGDEAEGTEEGRLVRPGKGLALSWGAHLDRAVPADYDGDGKTDVAVWSPDSGVWSVLFAKGNFNRAKASLGVEGFGMTFQWGLPGDIPIAADFNGDGCADAVVVRQTGGERSDSLVWHSRISSCDLAGTSVSTWSKEFGESGDTPLAADYDGDGAWDIAVVRPETGEWAFARPIKKRIKMPLAVGAQPFVADFDGDGLADPAIFNENGPNYYSFNTGSGDKLRVVRWSGSQTVPTVVLQRMHRSGR